MPPAPPHVFDEIVHKALASHIRQEILLVLAKKPKYLSELAAEIKKKPQTVDFHLNILTEIGLVESNWIEGKKYYTLKDKKILSFLRGRKAVPPEFRPKPPHEIVLDAWKDIGKRLDKIEKKLADIEKKLK
ncbi:MAG: winged helix-turn-helix transcriptional regulator [Nanoarchaeota archaeon]|nr:winged helix-turn-helix transcriptional regulator [Nanoarchaeota archaeon]